VVSWEYEYWLEIWESCTTFWWSALRQNPLGIVPFSLFLTVVHLIPVSVFVVFRDGAIGVSDTFMVVFSDGHEQLPPRHHH
jgi:hypothetical protein